MLAAEKVAVWNIHKPKSAWHFCARGRDASNEEFHSDSCVIYLGPGCSRRFIPCFSQRRTSQGEAAEDEGDPWASPLQHGAGPQVAEGYVGIGEGVSVWPFLLQAKPCLFCKQTGIMTSKMEGLNQCWWIIVSGLMPHLSCWIMLWLWFCSQHIRETHFCRFSLSRYVSRHVPLRFSVPGGWSQYSC